MSNSPLVDYVKISPNKTVNRRHMIDTITPHCVVGQASVESIGNVFASRLRRASSNYGVGYDGRIGMYVEEKDRSFCSSNRANDERAITIEIASNTTHPYTITKAAYQSTVKLCVDICKRNGIKELKWKADKSLIGNVDQQNITVHRWFANKACPGDYIYERLGQIAAEVNRQLKSSKWSSDQGKTEADAGLFKVRVDIPNLRIRTGPGVMYRATGRYTGKGVFTISETKGRWGKLKSGSGWISLDYATKL